MGRSSPLLYSSPSIGVSIDSSREPLGRIKRSSGCGCAGGGGTGPYEDSSSVMKESAPDAGGSSDLFRAPRRPNTMISQSHSRFLWLVSGVLGFAMWLEAVILHLVELLATRSKICEPPNWIFRSKISLAQNDKNVAHRSRTINKRHDSPVKVLNVPDCLHKPSGLIRLTCCLSDSCSSRHNRHRNVMRCEKSEEHFYLL
jgi:hypothetical protein